MLILHVDESLDDQSGMCIVGGYLGKTKQWSRYAAAWTRELAPRAHLHFNQLHLASQHAPKRYGELLRKLAIVPNLYGLKPFVGSICKEDYRPRVAGTVLETMMEGYVLAILALLDTVAAHLRPHDRFEVVFERQDIYSAQRERAMNVWNELPHHTNIHGRPLVTKWRSIDKCALTEASDYLCYALLQRGIDRASQKAQLTAPILEAQRYIRNHQGKDVVDGWLDQIEASRSRPIAKLTPALKKFIRKG